VGRKVRLFFEGVSLHILVTGINQEKIFRDEEDYAFYTELLDEISDSLHVDVHAYTLMPNSIHFLCSFDHKDLPSRFMQSLGLKYVSYFNKKYNRSGTLWQGRYKSSFVEDKFVLQVMHYIESLKISEHSSYAHNVLNKEDAIITTHEMYKLLGNNNKDRASIYKNIALEEDMVAFIEEHLNRQSITGSPEFYKKLESIVGETLMAKKRGRPKKKKEERKREKKMFIKLVALDKETHKLLKISPLADLKFAKDLSFVPVLANETNMVGEMFPVVFTTDEKPALVALTALGKGNLAINAEGKYISRYVPAFLRKHPFSLASTGKNKDQKAILIDEEASCVSKTKGKQLFNKDGEQSETLKNAIKFLTDYETQNLNTLKIVKIIKDSGILEDREISVGDGEEKKVLVNGFQVVSREKLNKLDDATLALWVRKGIISFIDSHINSLSKIEVLFKLASQNQQN